MTVEEYTSKFYNLATPRDFEWHEDVMIASFRKGLKPQISSRLSAAMFHSLGDAIQVARQVEPQFAPKSSFRTTTPTSLVDQPNGESNGKGVMDWFSSI